MINIQHWPCCQWIMICAALNTTVNLELRKLNFSEFKTTGKSGINELWLGKYVLNVHPTPNCKSGLFLDIRPEDQWCHHNSTLFFFPSSQLFCPRRTVAPPSSSHEHSIIRWVQKCIVCCYMNYVICQGDMYAVARKLILSVCCVIRC